jgi:hypothetical protein
MLMASRLGGPNGLECDPRMAAKAQAARDAERPPVKLGSPCARVNGGVASAGPRRKSMVSAIALLFISS